MMMRLSIGACQCLNGVLVEKAATEEQLFVLL